MSDKRERRKDDPWLYVVPRTDDELRAERAESIAWHAEHHGRIIDRGFTCDNCPMKAICSLAFDGYNTEGDCLYDK